MAQIRYVPDRSGLLEVLASGPVAKAVAEHADGLAARAGDGFVASQQMGRFRQRAIVYPDSWSAKRRAARENTLVRVLG